MFNFEEDEDGSEDRYRQRPTLWEETKHGAIYHYCWWLIHNLVSHPLIGLFPVKPFFRLHDWTSHHMHNRKGP